MRRRNSIPSSTYDSTVTPRVLYALGDRADRDSAERGYMYAAGAGDGARREMGPPRDAA